MTVARVLSPPSPSPPAFSRAVSVDAVSPCPASPLAPAVEHLRVAAPHLRANQKTTYLGAIWSAHSALQGGVVAAVLLATPSQPPWMWLPLAGLLLWDVLHLFVGIGLMKRRPRARKAALFAMSARVALYLVALPFQLLFVMETFQRDARAGLTSFVFALLLPLAGFFYAALHLLGALYLRSDATRAEFEENA